MRLDFWRKEEGVEKKEAAMFPRFSPKREDQKKVHIGGQQGRMFNTPQHGIQGLQSVAPNLLFQSNFLNRPTHT